MRKLVDKSIRKLTRAGEGEYFRHYSHRNRQRFGVEREAKGESKKD